MKDERVKKMLVEAANQGKLNYVIKKTDEMRMPASVAVIPMVESHYQTTAISSKGAAGAWQLMPMANNIVAASPRSSNPVSYLSFFNAALRERRGLDPGLYANYQRELATLVGLSFTASLAEGCCIWSYEPNFATFLRYRDFSLHTDKHEQLSIAIAEIVCNAHRSFEAIGFPRFYGDFNKVLINSLKSSGTTNAEIEKGIKKMIQMLFEQGNQN